MENKQLVSLVLPIYNVEAYLGRCIDSVLAQTYQNIEVILVDDGATDSSGKICDAYEKKDPRISVIHKQNGGLSSARNAGLAVANGEYICFIDSDDYIHPDYIADLLNACIEQNCEIAVCQIKDTFGCQIEEAPMNGELSCFTSQDFWKRYYHLSAIETVVAWNKLYKKSLFEGISYPEGEIHEDESTTYKLIFAANKIAYVPKAMYYYFQRENSIVNSGFSVKKIVYCNRLVERIAFFEERGLGDFVKGDQKNLLEASKNYYCDSKQSKVADQEVYKLLWGYYKKSYSLVDKSSYGTKERLQMFLFRYFRKVYELKW